MTLTSSSPPEATNKLMSPSKMADRKGWVHIEFYCSLPDDDLESDHAFDAMCDEVVDALNNAKISGMWMGTISVTDGNTEIYSEAE